MCFDICAINMRVSIRVRGLHLVFWSKTSSSISPFRYKNNVKKSSNFAVLCCSYSWNLVLENVAWHLFIGTLLGNLFFGSLAWEPVLGSKRWIEICLSEPCMGICSCGTCFETLLPTLRNLPGNLIWVRNLAWDSVLASKIACSCSSKFCLGNYSWKSVPGNMSNLFLGTLLGNLFVVKLSCHLALEPCLTTLPVYLLFKTLLANLWFKALLRNLALNPCLGTCSWEPCWQPIVRNLPKEFVLGTWTSSWEPVLRILAWEPVLANLACKPVLGNLAWGPVRENLFLGTLLANLFLETLLGNLGFGCSDLLWDLYWTGWRPQAYAVREQKIQTTGFDLASTKEK